MGLPPSVLDIVMAYVIPANFRYCYVPVLQPVASMASLSSSSSSRLFALLAANNGLAPMDGNVRHSKFGGSPYVMRGESWPVCGSCHIPLTFFFQLRFDHLPPEIRYADEVPPPLPIGAKPAPPPPSLLQFWYCTENDTCNLYDKCEPFKYVAPFDMH
jgi:hypothetical protein